MRSRAGANDDSLGVGAVTSRLQPDAGEEFELALARLEWVRAAASCLDLPAQREALEWHVACWRAALAALAPAAGDEK